MKSKYGLGIVAQDVVTGYSGRVTALALYITGEITYLIENVDSTGRPCDYWVNESRIVVLDDGAETADKKEITEEISEEETEVKERE